MAGKQIAHTSSAYGYPLLIRSLLRTGLAAAPECPSENFPSL
jgi:hypothetical protein